MCQSLLGLFEIPSLLSIINERNFEIVFLNSELKKNCALQPNKSFLVARPVLRLDPTASVPGQSVARDPRCDIGIARTGVYFEIIESDADQSRAPVSILPFLGDTEVLTQSKRQ